MSILKCFVSICLLSVTQLANAAATANINQKSIDNTITTFFIGLIAVVGLAVYAAIKLSDQNSENSDNKSSGCFKPVMIFIGIFVLGCVVVFKMALDI